MRSNYSKELKGLGQAERTVIDSLVKAGRLVVQAENLEALFGYKKSNANLFLSRLTQKGWLQRLSPGTYRIIPLGSDTPNPVPDDPLPIAMELFPPCYISGWTAAEHWDLTEQIFNTTLVFTQQKLRQTDHTIAGLNFKTKTVPPVRFFGLKKTWSNTTQIQIADIHKTIVDILDDPAIGGGGVQSVEIFRAYMQSKEANWDMMIKYAQQLKHGAVYKRLGLLLDNFSQTEKEQIVKLHNQIKKGIINFDPSAAPKGPIHTKWGIRLNIPLNDIR